MSGKSSQSSLFSPAAPPVAVAESVVEVEIIGDIGFEVDAAAVRKQITAADPKAEIAVGVHSGGGSIFDSYLIHNSLIDHSGPVSVKILGLAASAAAWIPLAADPGRITMHHLGQWMAHEGRSGAFGTAADHDKQAELLRSLDNQMAGLFAKRSGSTIDEALAMMAAGEYLTAAAAQEAGFVDAVIGDEAPANRIDLSRHDVPDAVAALFGLGAEPRPEDPFFVAVAAAAAAQDLTIMQSEPVNLAQIEAALSAGRLQGGAHA